MAVHLFARPFGAKGSAARWRLLDLSENIGQF